MEGITDALNSQASPIAEADMEAAFNEINVRLQAQQEEASKELSAKGEAFLADNAGRDGVTVTDSGLQYEVITEGSGEIPTSDSTVRTHYHGSLISGKVFDSSVERGEPAEFPVSGVIAGWTEALQMMPIGSKWRLFVPHQLAYGQQGAGADIGPCEALIFEVELLAIV
jgi:FKBP-type peptidyl-prolyl cis-trans isomerase FklB